MTDPRDPHFLHEKEGLSPVISPPLDDVRAIGWVPERELLVVATGDGRLSTVDPVMGQHLVCADVGEVGALQVSADRSLIVLVTRTPAVELRELATGKLLQRMPIELIGDQWVGFWSGGIAVTGRGLDRRAFVVFDAKGGRRAQGDLPEGYSIGVGPRARLQVVRASTGGPEVSPLGKALPPAEVTSHRLRLFPSGALLGLAEGGVTIWGAAGASPRTLRGFHITSATLDKDARHLAIGTRTGTVLFVGVPPQGALQPLPVRAGGHEGAVRAVAFSDRGRWLATVGQRLWLWTW